MRHVLRHVLRHVMRHVTRHVMRSAVPYLRGWTTAYFTAHRKLLARDTAILVGIHPEEGTLDPRGHTRPRHWLGLG